MYNYDMAKRDQRFNFMATEEEIRMLRMVAESEGLDASAFIRQAIRDAFKRLAKENGRTPTEMLRDA